MILQPKETTVAYRCPECGSAIKSVVGVFALSAEKICLKCPCGKSEMTIRLSKDGKVRISVPCFICRTDHTYTINSNVLFSDEIFYLHCMYSGINICFIGKEDTVSQQIDLTLDELEKLLGAPAEELFGEIEQTPDGIPDVSELSGIVTVIKELAADGKILCDCPPSDGGELLYDPQDYLMVTGIYENNCNGTFRLVCEDNVLLLECTECGCKYVFDKDTTAESFAQNTELRLK